MAKSLLLVDDSVAIREVVALTFENTDLTVRTAADREKAWAALQEERADIVIADADKPQIGGWELCRRLKDDPKFGSIPVILFSGEDDERPRLTDLTPDALLSKPFSSDDLGKTVAALTGLVLRPEESESEAEEVEPTETRVSMKPVKEKRRPARSAFGSIPDAKAATPRPAKSHPSQKSAQASQKADPSVEDIRSAIESAVRQTLAQSLQGLDEDELRRVIASAVRDALKDLASQITGLVERVVREVVPELAEIWIEREIQRLKAED